MAKGKRIREENVFHGIGFEIENTKTERDDGSIVPWQLIHYYGCSCVLAINEKEEVLIEANFRYPYCKEILEIPAGEKEEGETWLDAAKRELKEETGSVGEEWSDLGIIYPSVGSSDEVRHLFLARKLKKEKNHLDAEERITCSFIPREQILKLIQNGQLPDAKTQSAIFNYLLKQGKNIATLQIQEKVNIKTQLL